MAVPEGRTTEAAAAEAPYLPSGDEFTASGELQLQHQQELVSSKARTGTRPGGSEVKLERAEKRKHRRWR